MTRSHRFVVGIAFLALAALAVVVTALGVGDPFTPSETLLAPPSVAHPFGTDELGRDILARVLHGAATALRISFPPALAAAVVGTIVGLVGGYVGGIVDEVLLKLIELVLVVPRFLIALVVVALFGGSLTLLAIVLAATFWPATARLVRAEAISLRERPFIEAARAVGAGDARIVMRHLLLLVIPLVVVNSSFQAGQAALIEAGLAFLGLGDRNVVSWGAMLADAQSYLGIAWWTSVFPGIALALMILTLNLLGDGLADTWNIRGRV
ncbi:MAG: ABC transporter permease [Actinobacteria bacterium]|nr:ABC transporter permease [Actinomycetota bacterium]